MCTYLVSAVGSNQNRISTHFSFFIIYPSFFCLDKGCLARRCVHALCCPIQITVVPQTQKERIINATITISPRGFESFKIWTKESTKAVLVASSNDAKICKCGDSQVAQLVTAGGCSSNKLAHQCRDDRLNPLGNAVILTSYMNRS